MSEQNASVHARPNSTLGVISFLILAFGLAWGLWWLLLPHGITVEDGSMSRNARWVQFLLLPGAFAPAAATFIVRKWITREGFADAGLGLHLDKWRYYLIGWFLPFAVLAFIVIEAGIFGIARPDFAVAASLAKLAPQVKIPPAVASVLVYIIPAQTLLSALTVTPLLFGEEFGWRGYLQLRLFPGRPTLAAIGTGVIWGLWHLPIILRGGEYPGVNPILGICVFCVATTLIAIVFGWLRERSGSVWCTSLAHAATNAVGGSLTVLWFADRSHWLFVSYAGILSWIPFGLLAAWIVLSRANAPRRLTPLSQTSPS